MQVNGMFSTDITSHLKAIENAHQVEKHVLNQVDFQVWRSCALTCKAWNNFITSREDYQKAAIPAFHLIAPEAVDALGGLQKLYSLPQLKIDREIKISDPLNFITPDMMSAPFMRGIDNLGRPFISIKVLEDMKDGSSKAIVFTLFNLLSDTLCFAICQGARVSEGILYNRIKKLVSNGELTVKHSVTIGHPENFSKTEILGLANFRIGN